MKQMSDVVTAVAPEALKCQTAYKNHLKQLTVKPYCTNVNLVGYVGHTSQLKSNKTNNSNHIKQPLMQTSSYQKSLILSIKGSFLVPPNAMTSSDFDERPNTGM